jgi:RNA polymerase sigma-70 factor (ECF subfamily)
MRAARNLALDVVRRQKVFREKEPEIIHLIESGVTAPDVASLQQQEIADDTLRLMFVCCHPLIPPDAQAALALKTLCGFSVSEISRAFLTSEAAIAKRLVRAKQKVREERVSFAIPAGQELGSRLDGVLRSLYLLFNEGYKASSGDKLIREDVCSEAIRLTGLLAQHPAGNRPKTHALLALMLLNAARFPARMDNEGNLLRLEDQDRSRWDASLVGRGMLHFARSAAGEELSDYHLQAGIAACHSTAKDFASTDWVQILALYDRLLAFDPSPVVALNRAVAVANIQGPAAGIAAIAVIRDRAELESYYLLYAVLGELEARQENFSSAASHFQKALELTSLGSEQAFLSRRVEDCDHRASLKRVAAKNAESRSCLARS